LTNFQAHQNFIKGAVIELYSCCALFQLLCAASAAAKTHQHDAVARINN
jgi:hypothetical protein